LLCIFQCGYRLDRAICQIPAGQIEAAVLKTRMRYPPGAGTSFALGHPSNQGGRLQKIKVLIVDDEANIRTRVQACLEGEQYQILQATNGVEALAAIETYMPDVMILDLAMPLLDGLSVLAKLKHLWNGLPTRVIVVTAAELIGIAPQAGAGTYAFSDAAGVRIGFVQIIPASHNEVTVHRIWTLECRRGHGSTMLRWICELADRHGIILKLRALPFGKKPYPLSRVQLLDWYGRHGFEGKRWKLVRMPVAKNMPSAPLALSPLFSGWCSERGHQR
jgi:CheY-like chemotaxis protein